MGRSKRIVAKRGIGAGAAALALLLTWIAGCAREIGPERGGTAAGGATADGAAENTVALRIAPVELPPDVLDPLRTAMAAYEEARDLLAGDDVAGLSPRAERLAASIELARAALAEPPSDVALWLGEASAAARALAAAEDLAAARNAFGEVSRFLIALAAADPRLAAGWHVFECPMTKTFPKWMQPSDQLENPYMGTGMSTCGAPADWTVPVPSSLAGAQAHADAVHGGDIAYYTCSMHTSVRSTTPGTCPLCSMDLVPVTQEEVATGIVRIEAARRQSIGVTTAPASRRPLTTSIRAVGTVVYDQTRLAEVTVKYAGWIHDLRVNEPGQAVRRGQVLFTLYSPDLYATQREYLTALASQRAARETGAPDRADYLVQAAHQRLRLWDLEQGQIEQIAEIGEPIEHLPIPSPVTGHVVEKNVVAGSAVQPGMTLYRIAGLDRIWVEAEVYESELPQVAVGQPARVTLPHLPGESFTGRVAFVYPYLEGATRTGRVRVELQNPELAFKPDMFANVLLERDLGERLVVPEEAVLYAGERSFVFVDLGDGRLKPTAVETGMKTPEHVEILAGIDEGDVVVTSGNFLIAAESRLKLDMEHWR